MFTNYFLMNKDVHDRIKLDSEINIYPVSTPSMEGSALIQS